MYCSNCGNLCGETDNFCSNCGNPLSSFIPPKKGSHWVPVLIMVLLCAIGIALFFAIPYSPAPAAKAADYSWFYVDNGTLYFEESRYEGPSELTVPGELFGQRVTALSDGCFEGCVGLTSVILPDTLESIGKAAFRDCTALRGVEIPESVKRIGIEAFYGCTALEAVCLTDSLEYVGPGAFGECNKLYYILFLGSHGDWMELYDEFIAPYTAVFCDEGSFYQGKGIE